MSATMIHYFSVELELCEPGAVLEPVETTDAAEANAHLDMRPARDHEGRWTMPATSVAGSMRDHLAKTHPGLAEEVMGFFAPDGAHPSSLRILGTRLVDDVRLLDEHSTAIDRHRGAAANRTLRHIQVLPEGARFEVFLRWDDPKFSQLEIVLEEIGRWRPFLGASVSSGHGACRVTQARHGVLDLGTAEGMLAFLTQGGPELAKTVAVAPVALADGARVEHLAFSFELASALHVGTGQTTGDKPKVATVFRRCDNPAISGRTLRGVFRSRAEFILRSVGVDACANDDCGSCVICTLFGHSADDPTSASVGLRSSLRFLDTVIVDAQVTRRSHVAIDRFTGGATPGLLFTDEVVDRGRFQVRVNRLGGTDEQWKLAEALLVLVAQDLHDGYVAIGGATTRGQGTVRLTSAQPEELANAQEAIKVLVDNVIAKSPEAL